MNMKITKREVRFFLLGMLAMFLMEAALDWKGTVASFKRGYNEAGAVENTAK
jgi:hypothetical protein